MLKNFLLSTLIIWIYLFVIIINFGFKEADQVWELLYFLSFFIPVFLLIAVVLPILNIYVVNRKKKSVFGKVAGYFIAAWALFFLILEVSSGTAKWLENRWLYGNDVEEAKVELIQKAEQSIENRYHQGFELVDTSYFDEGKFLKVRYLLKYKDDRCVKDCESNLIAFSLSYEKDGWRMKRLDPTDIWFLESE